MNTLAAWVRQHAGLTAVLLALVNLTRRFSESLGAKLYARTLYLPIAGADVVEGARGTGNIGTNILETDFANKVLELEPDAAPLTVLSARLDKQKAINPKFTWFEDVLDVRFDAIDEGAGYDDNDTVLTVDNGGYFHADDLVYITRTGEIVRVSSVDGDDLTVVRGVGAGAAAIVDNDELIVLNSAAEEGALDKPARSGNPTEVFNYTQIFRDPVEITGTAESSASRISPNEWNRILHKKGIEHMKNIEYAALFGRPSVSTAGTHPRRTTGGFNYYATQNVTDVGGAMTEAEFFAAFRAPFRYGSRTKLAMAATVPVDVLSGFARSKLQVEQGENTFGLKITQVISPHGVVNFVTHWLLEGAVHGKEIWIVDMDNVGYRYLHGDDGSRDTKIRHEIQSPGADTRKDEYLTECGFVFGQPLTHGKIKNITS
jgi:hypothetical protein